MNKYQQFKEAVRNTPPERLARIEYQSHFFQMMGISIVCIVLIVKGLWWVIFAFIFGLGISYSGGMSAYIKYRNIMALLKPEHFSEYEKDQSPTRKRGKIVDHVFGKGSKWVAIVIAVLGTFIILGDNYSRVTLSLLYPIVSIIFYFAIYFILFYWVAHPIYKKQVEVK